MRASFTILGFCGKFILELTAFISPLNPVPRELTDIFGNW